jgi:hypothetical protein
METIMNNTIHPLNQFLTCRALLKAMRLKDQARLGMLAQDALISEMLDRSESLYRQAHEPIREVRIYVVPLGSYPQEFTSAYAPRTAKPQPQSVWKGWLNATAKLLGHGK